LLTLAKREPRTRSFTEKKREGGIISKRAGTSKNRRGPVVVAGEEGRGSEGEDAASI